MKRKNDFVMQNVGGANLLVPTGSKVMDLNGLITLNDSAAFMWQLLAEEQTVESLIEAIIREYKLEADMARVDVLNFLEEITEMGLLNR